MPNCHLMLDSCCDLPYEMVDREGITLLKFTYSIANGTFEDDLFHTNTPESFYGSMREGAEPSTSMYTSIAYEEAFEEAAKKGVPTVYLCFTSGLSGSYDMALMARDAVLERYPNFELYVVDTLLPSIIEGLLVLGAIGEWEKGLSAKELADWADEAKYFTDCAFMVDNFDSLKKGGRIPASVAYAGSKLDVKPILSVDQEGKLCLIGVARGRKKGINQLVEYFEKNRDYEGQSPYVCIGDADCKKDLKKLEDALLKIDESLLPVECNIGPVIGSHVGPGMLAVAFWGKDKRDKKSAVKRFIGNRKDK